MRRIGLALARHRHFHHHLLPFWFDRRPPSDPCCGPSGLPQQATPQSPESSGTAILKPRPLQPPSAQSP